MWTWGESSCGVRVNGAHLPRMVASLRVLLRRLLLCSRPVPRALCEEGCAERQDKEEARHVQSEVHVFEIEYPRRFCVTVFFE